MLYSRQEGGVDVRVGYDMLCDVQTASHAGATFETASNPPRIYFGNAWPEEGTDGPALALDVLIPTEHTILCNSRSKKVRASRLHHRGGIYLSC